MAATGALAAAHAVVIARGLGAARASLAVFPISTRLATQLQLLDTQHVKERRRLLLL